MKRFYLASLLIFIFSVTDIHAQKNWTPLFDGTTLNGWKQMTGKATFQPFRGTIMGVSAPNSPNSFLCTEAEYGDFALEMEVMMDDTSFNSGVQFRSHYDKSGNNGAGRFMVTNMNWILHRVDGQVAFMMKGAETGFIRFR